MPPLKNVKIDADIHRKISVKAAELGVHKGVLTDALISAALEHLDDEGIRKWVEIVVTSNDNSEPHS